MTHASSCTRTRISVSTRECVCTMIYSQSFRAMGSHEAARSLACLIILLKGPQQFYISRGLETPRVVVRCRRFLRCFFRGHALCLGPYGFRFFFLPLPFSLLSPLVFLSLCWGISPPPRSSPSSYATLLNCLFPLYLVLC